MAAFQRLFRGSLGPAAAVGGVVIASAATVAHADEGLAIVHPGRTANGDKLPIYGNPNDEGTVTLVIHHNPLSEHIATAREATAEAVGSVRGVVQQGVSHWIDFERGVEREVKSIVPKDENLTPGIIYVLVAGLTGSVLTRTRAFPIRFLAPPVFAAAALPFFLPKTARNLRAYISDLEDKNAPDFAAKHDAFNQNLEMHWHMAVDRLRGVTHDAAQWSSKAAEGVESATGLRVGDALRRQQSKVAETRATLRDEIAALPDAPALTPPAPVTAPVVLEKVGTVVEQKPIAEIVVAVPADEAPKEASTVEVPVAAAPAVVVPTEAKPKAADSGKRLV